MQLFRARRTGAAMRRDSFTTTLPRTGAKTSLITVGLEEAYLYWRDGREDSEQQFLSFKSSGDEK